jgi:hypothetical protein
MRVRKRSAIGRGTVERLERRELLAAALVLVPKPVDAVVVDQSGNTASATSTADASGGFVFTGALAPFSDTSPTHAGGFTNTNRPTFLGTAPPFALVQLVARPINIDAVLPLGQTVVGSAGQWTLSTGPLADGIYSVTAVVTPPGGFPGPPVPIANNGQLVIDTSSPRVVAVTPIGATSQVYITLHAGQSGLNILRLLSPLNYLFYGPKAAPMHPTSVALAPSGVQPDGTQSVVLTAAVSPRSFRRFRDLAITGAGITDMAGTPLPGDVQVSLVGRPARAPRLARH